MDEPMVSCWTGSMNSLVNKLTERENRPKIIGELLADVVKLKDLFDQVALRDETDAQVRAWMGHVRELVYEVEDWVDAKPATNKKEIKKFKTQIKDVCDRCQWYRLLQKAATPQPVHDHFTPREANGAVGTHQLLEDKTGGLVGVDDPVNELVSHLVDKHEILKVVSIVGMEGLGKTTLAKEVYSEIQCKFECRAFVVAGRRPSMVAILKDILRQVKLGHSLPKTGVKPETNRRADSKASDPQKVIAELWGYLGTKRYFIVIDGLWSTRDWKIINCALPDKNQASRVLTTTCIRDVAKSCCMHPSDVVYQMKALSQDNARSLLLQSIPDKDQMVAHFDEVSAKILKTCDGMPLAIAITAGLLDRNSAEQAEVKMAGKYILSSLDQYSFTSKGMSKILHMSYADLSMPLKSCFLYLSVFPEDYTIRKDRLIRLWEAEGFIKGTYCARRGLSGNVLKESMWVIGEKFFNELIIRRLIQPVFNYDDDEEVGCTVHGVILDFIRCLARKENFITVASDLGSGLFPCSTNTVRRFSFDCNGDEDEAETLVSRIMHLSSMRSLTVFGDVEWMAIPRDSEDTERKFVPEIVSAEMAGHSALTNYRGNENEGIPVLPSFKFIRVLDLEGAHNYRSHHLKGIEGLVLMRYLGLRGTGIDRLPGEIGKLEHLETLDVRQTNLRTLPASIVESKKLVRLLMDSTVKLPRDIWRMEGLEEVSSIGVDQYESDLYFWLSYRQNRQSLRLTVLGLRVTGSNLFVLHVLQDLPPMHLRKFELTISGPIKEGYIHILYSTTLSITHLQIEIAQLDKLSVFELGRLDHLVLLKLVSAGNADRMMYNSSRIQSFIWGFKCLKVLWFTCKGGGNQLKFQHGSMRQLQRLRLTFGARDTLSRYEDFDFGIEHLAGLTRIHATIVCEGATVSQVEAAENAIRKQALQISTNRPTIEFSRELEHEMI